MKTTLKRSTFAALAASSLVVTGVISTEAAQALTLISPPIGNEAIIDSSSVNQSFTIYSYGGSIGLPGGEVFSNDLRSEARFTLNSFDGTIAQFTIQLTNNSGQNSKPNDRITASRLSSFGFDAVPSNGTFNGDGSTVLPGGVFNIADAGQVPQRDFLGFNQVDVCFRLAPPRDRANNCNAGSGGIFQTLPNNTGSFTTDLRFAGGPVTSFSLQNFYFRYQSIDGTVGNSTFAGASGVGTPGVVPTPALLPGLVGLGVAALRKKQGDKVTEEV